jgi:hypothetical protein
MYPEGEAWLPTEKTRTTASSHQEIILMMKGCYKRKTNPRYICGGAYSAAYGLWNCQDKIYPQIVQFIMQLPDGQELIVCLEIQNDFPS